MKLSYPCTQIFNLSIALACSLCNFHAVASDYVSAYKIRLLIRCTMRVGGLSEYFSIFLTVKVALCVTDQFIFRKTV